jgi:hypothetical protein
VVETNKLVKEIIQKWEPVFGPAQKAWIKAKDVAFPNYVFLENGLNFISNDATSYQAYRNWLKTDEEYKMVCTGWVIELSQYFRKAIDGETDDNLLLDIIKVIHINLQRLNTWAAPKVSIGVKMGGSCEVTRGRAVGILRTLS